MSSLKAQKLEEIASAIVTNLERAWNSADADAWSHQYAEDAEFMNISGRLVLGRENIRKRHADLFSGDLRGTTFHARIRQVRPIGEKGMLLCTVADVSNLKAIPAGAMAYQPGLLRTLFTFVVAEDSDSSWRIISSQNILIQPDVPTPA